jgi:hypothetical protein
MLLDPARHLTHTRLTKRNRETLRVLQRLSAGLGDAARSMILNGLRLGAGRAIRPLRETLRDLQPKTAGETLQDVPAGGLSVQVEGASDNASSSGVQLLSIARGRRSDTCTEGRGIDEAD